MTTIIVTHEDNEIDEFEFKPGHQSISIGRRSSNDVCVPNLSVSGNHARIVFENNRARIEDLKSTNGTYIKGLQISRQEIQDGDEIILGKVRLTFLNAGYEPAPAYNSTQAESASAISSHDLSSDLAQMALEASERASPATGTTDYLSANVEQAATKLAGPIHAKNLGIPTQASPVKSVESDENEASYAQDASLFDQAPKSINGASAPSSAATTSEPPHPLENVDRHDASSVAPMHELDSPPSASKGAVIEIKNGAKSGQILPIDKPVTTLGRPGIQIAAIMRKPDGYFLMHIESDDSVDRPTLNQDAIGDEPVLLHSGDELNVAGIDVEFMLS